MQKRVESGRTERRFVEESRVEYSRVGDRRREESKE